MASFRASRDVTLTACSGLLAAPVPQEHFANTNVRWAISGNWEASCARGNRGGVFISGRPVSELRKRLKSPRHDRGLDEKRKRGEDEGHGRVTY